MMRSMFSGVAGMKVHQSKMDVIGNNIANVNTVGFKGSSTNFSDTFYQTISSASGANAATGSAGTNAKQIGLGANLASITTNITNPGGTQVTDRGMDVAINGDSFLIVQYNGMTYFTKSGALNVDEEGMLYCTTNGATVMGWGVDADGQVVKDTVQPLHVMSADNMYVAPTNTTQVTMTGNIDKNDPQVANTNEGDTFTTGLPLTFSFFDKLGEEYLVKMYVQQDADADYSYKMRLADIYDSDGNSVFVQETTNDDGTTTFGATSYTVTIEGVTYTPTVNEDTGELTLTGGPIPLLFDGNSGHFVQVGDGDTDVYQRAGDFISFTVNSGDPLNNPFPAADAATEKGGIEVDFSKLTMYSQGGTSNTSYKKGDAINGNDGGNTAGKMSGIRIDDSGKIFGVYDNGETRCLGQMAVTTFANPSGLEAVGNSMFAASLNSGEFDGIGSDIKSVGGKFSVGALELSNVDLAGEFVSMITTQRGFQANSRIITTSDSLLEEVVNMKR